MTLEPIEIQGETFNYVPRTQSNIEDVTGYIRETERNRVKLRQTVISLIQEDPEMDPEVAEEKAKEEIGFTEVPDKFEMLREVFRRALDGPHDKIDHEEVTWDQLAEVRENFIPPPMRVLGERNVS
jgi:hypothetical protein